MPRWEHGSEDRLKQAAMELFDEQGFENTSVVEIAKRARVTTRTFFRYFPDKQEVVFADAEQLSSTLVERIRQVSDVGEPLQVVARVLTSFDWASLGSRESQRRRYALIETNAELLERELIKQHRMVSAFVDALCETGMDADTARLAALVGIHVFRVAYGRWLEAVDTASLAATNEAMMSLLATIVPGAAVASSSPAARDVSASQSTEKLSRRTRQAG